MRYGIKEHSNQGYRVEKKGDKHHIWEVGTQQYIAEYGSSSEAKAEVRRYKLGKGFNGWTPPFMMGTSTNMITDYNGSAYYDDDIMDVD